MNIKVQLVIVYTFLYSILSWGIDNGCCVESADLVVAPQR